MERVKAKVLELGAVTKKVARDDPRRVVHSLKVGLALTLVSLFYYYQPIFDNFGDAAMWAVMTVVVVFEFTVGATLGKGLNRGFATLLGAALGVGAHHIASFSGETLEPIILGIFVFLQAALSTFMRFVPEIKKRHDYGCLIFILTFSLVSVSGYREDEIIDLAHKRLSTVIIGGAACVIVSICLCPVWAGEDLHNLIANNIAKLGTFLEGFGDEYFRISEGIEEEKKKDVEAYKSVLNSKNTEESLANLAWWEPRHGRFQFRHPWEHYLTVGALTRQCAYRADALNAHLLADVQASQETKTKVKEACRTMSFESGKALKELSLSMKRMTKPSFAQTHLEKSQSACKTLNSLLKSGIWNHTELLEALHVATVAFLLIDIVNFTEKISDSVYELASSAGFREEIEPTVSPELSKGISGQETVRGKNPTAAVNRKRECPEVVINVDDHRDEKTEHAEASSSRKPEIGAAHEIPMAVVTESPGNDVVTTDGSRRMKGDHDVVIPAQLGVLTG